MVCTWMSSPRDRATASPSGVYKPKMISPSSRLIGEADTRRATSCALVTDWTIFE